MATIIYVSVTSCYQVVKSSRLIDSSSGQILHSCQKSLDEVDCNEIIIGLYVT